MWAAFVRQIAAFAITRRGKRFFALIGVLLLCFAAALLIDFQLYVSAVFTTLLALVSAAAFVVHHVRLKRSQRERLARKAEAAQQRALAAQARLARIDGAKSAFSGAVRDSAGAATKAARDTMTGVWDGAAAMAVRTAGGAQEVVRYASVRTRRAVVSAQAGAAFAWRAVRVVSRPPRRQSP